MAILGGPTPSEGHSEKDFQRDLDYSEQPTLPDLAIRPQHVNQQDAPAPAGYQMSPILENAIRMAKARDFVIPLCPLCLMAYEEELGRFINLDNTIPQFCWHHQKWLAQGTKQERFLKMHVMHTALSWYLWPPGFKWHHLG